MHRMNKAIWVIVGGLALAMPGCGQRLVVDAATEAVAAEPAQPPNEEEAIPSKPVFPTDRSGALLSDLLAPSIKAPVKVDSSRPRQRSLPPPSEPAVLPLPPSTASLPQLTVETPRKTARPADVAEALPFFDQLGRPQLPERPFLPTPAPVRLPSPDVNQPIALPILAQPISDRAPLDDPTAEISVGLALAVSPPLRTTPAAFIRFVLPNPFEHHETGRLRNPPEESPMPLTVAPRPPSKP